MQRRLIGEGWEKRKEIFKNKDKGNDDEEDWWISGKLQENQINYFNALCDDIMAERRRIGGHWVIAESHLIKKSVRNFMKYKLYILRFHRKTKIDILDQSLGMSQ